ncbi:MAG TPA: hypothetical protein PLD88_14740 [Candidatus Berkiella sp.]|nr:hypothetical protein [Candidatus Berkiella sp.]
MKILVSTIAGSQFELEISEDATGKQLNDLIRYTLAKRFLGEIDPLNLLGDAVIVEAAKEIEVLSLFAGRRILSDSKTLRELQIARNTTIFVTYSLSSKPKPDNTLEGLSFKALMLSTPKLTATQRQEMLKNTEGYTIECGARAYLKSNFRIR